ncbi:taurine ABC transporter substrate-binding protein [Microbacterium yannicii]|uniref:Taurine ABC transporter substrate-binding protein n=1 Tax=Microbacterium yannicii TaxID=671622 RepID=A0ABP9LZ70_9MICO|nr:ABC transporter substrate-binding protein [Microbacterium yannicii]MCO5954033.1 ABC transporter substrate-binding protein [Microbacterium yannicii]
MKKSLATLGVLAAAALALSGCTDSGATPSSTSTDDAAGGELTKVRVAALPIAETGALWAAIDEGIFEDHGLEIEVVPAQGGANAIPALLSGDIQFAIGQPFGPIRADVQDLGVVIVGNYANSLAEGDDVNAVVALGDSGITRPADLAGKKVSVNTIGAAGDLTIRKAVQDDGGDPSTIEFVEVAFPDVPAQLAAGTMDAAWAPDPFRGMVLGDGGVSVVAPYQATIPGLSVLTNITTQALLDEDPDLVADYSAAMSEALEWASDNEDAVRAAIATNLDIPEEAAAGITLPTFTWDLADAGIEDLGSLAVEFGYIDAEPDFDRLLQQQ